MDSEIREERKTIELGPYALRIEWHHDDTAPRDDGEYTDALKPGVIDRKTGALYGEYTEEPDSPCDECHEEDCGYVMWKLCVQAQRHIEVWAEWNDRHGLEVLADNLSTPYENRQYRYFDPYAGGEDIDSEYFVEYAKQDYERIVGLERGDWYYMGCWAKVFLNGVELASDSLWGIESDASDYLQEVERDVLSEAIARAPGIIKALSQSSDGNLLENIDVGALLKEAG